MKQKILSLAINVSTQHQGHSNSLALTFCFRRTLYHTTRLHLVDPNDPEHL